MPSSHPLGTKQLVWQPKPIYFYFITYWPSIYWYNTRVCCVNIVEMKDLSLVQSIKECNLNTQPVTKLGLQKCNPMRTVDSVWQVVQYGIVWGTSTTPWKPKVTTTFSISFQQHTHICQFGPSSSQVFHLAPFSPLLAYPFLFPTFFCSVTDYIMPHKIFKCLCHNKSVISGTARLIIVFTRTRTFQELFTSII